MVPFSSGVSVESVLSKYALIQRYLPSNDDGAFKISPPTIVAKSRSAGSVKSVVKADLTNSVVFVGVSIEKDTSLDTYSPRFSNTIGSEIAVPLSWIVRRGLKYLYLNPMVTCISCAA